MVNVFFLVVVSLSHDVLVNRLLLLETCRSPTLNNSDLVSVLILGMPLRCLNPHLPLQLFSVVRPDSDC